MLKSLLIALLMLAFSDQSMAQNKPIIGSNYDQALTFYSSIDIYKAGAEDVINNEKIYEYLRAYRRPIESMRINSGPHKLLDVSIQGCTVSSRYFNHGASVILRTLRPNCPNVISGHASQSLKYSAEVIYDALNSPELGQILGKQLPILSIHFNHSRKEVTFKNQECSVTMLKANAYSIEVVANTCSTNEVFAPATFDSSLDEVNTLLRESKNNGLFFQELNTHRLPILSIEPMVTANRRFIVLKTQKCQIRAAVNRSRPQPGAYYMTPVENLTLASPINCDHHTSNGHNWNAVTESAQTIETLVNSQEVRETLGTEYAIKAVAFNPMSKNVTVVTDLCEVTVRKNHQAYLPPVTILSDTCGPDAVFVCSDIPLRVNNQAARLTIVSEEVSEQMPNHLLELTVQRLNQPVPVSGLRAEVEKVVFFDENEQTRPGLGGHWLRVKTTTLAVKFNLRADELISQELVGGNVLKASKRAKRNAFCVKEETELVSSPVNPFGDWLDFFNTNDED